MPFVDPPVATLGRPFAIFFLRSIDGSSHDPAWVAVAEKSLTWETMEDDVLEGDTIRVMDEARVGRTAVVACDTLKPRKALRSTDEALVLIAAGLGLIWPVVELPACQSGKLQNPHGRKFSGAQHGPGPGVCRCNNPNPNLFIDISSP